MKIIVKSIVLLIGVLVPQIVPAQGSITYLSSLGPASASSDPVGSDSWLAAGFFTGNNVGGYEINSIQLAMTDASGNPNGFTVTVYSAIVGAGSNPGSSLGSFNGSLNPVTTDTYTFTPVSSLTLSPSTEYYIVLTAGTMVANGAYEWSVENTVPPGSGASPGPYGWYEDNAIYNSGDDGSLWTLTPYTGIAQFAVNATPAPEPGVLGLFEVGLGGLLFVSHRRRAV